MVGRIYKGLDGWEYWYDSSTRCWWAARFDAEGNQINEAINAYTKAEIEGAIS